ncbi:MAG TPA: hypothetical protein P5056_01450, partial [Candidatus Paceibacterota bacterium]|nr:hypothetical protein [Candidatus Paceibacterota bacterium]
KNGYFLTCHHCVNPLGDLLLLDNHGKVIEIEGVCLQDETTDIALVKAKIAGPREIIKYKYAQYLDTNEQIAILSRWMGKFSVTCGFVKYGICREKETGRFSLAVSQISKKGDSGGVVANMRGEILSIHKSASEITNTSPGAPTGPASISVPFFYITEFLEKNLFLREV